MVAAGMTDEKLRTGPLMHEVLGGAWLLPVGYVPDNVASCRGCGHRILWAITSAGRKSSRDPNGKSHFSSCVNAQRFRKDRAPKVKAIPCATCGKMPTSAYPDGSPRYDHQHADPIWPVR